MSKYSHITYGEDHDRGKEWYCTVLYDTSHKEFREIHAGMLHVQEERRTRTLKEVRLQLLLRISGKLREAYLIVVGRWKVKESLLVF